MKSKVRNIKKLLLLLALSALIGSETLSQTIPQGLRYQAIARDATGQVLVERPLVVSIEILAKSGSQEEVIYREIHNVRSTRLGLLNLIIGSGLSTVGAFEDIPWNTSEVWVKTSVKQEDQADYEIINSSKLYSVPYAFHALSAGEISASGLDDSKKRSADIGKNSINWSLEGNRDAQERNDGSPVLGTVDLNALVLVTNNIPRLSIDANGSSNFTGNLDVDGNFNTDVGVTLNTLGGSSILYGSSTVENMSPTHLTGVLQVDKASTLNALTVANMASTVLTGVLDVDKTMNVDGATTLNSSLDVTGMSPTHLTGTLTVDKAFALGDAFSVGNMAPTHFTGVLDVDKTMNVDGSSTLNSSLDVTGMNPTHLSGSLTVDKVTTLNDALTVENMASTHFTGTLQVDKDANVDGASSLNSSLDVLGMNPTHLTGTLTVDKLATFGVGLSISGDGLAGPNNDHLAFFNNTEGGQSDGIAIQIQETSTSKENNFMTFYRGDNGIAGRIEGYQFGDITPPPLPTDDEIWTALCIAIADYNPVTIFWTQMANNFNLLALGWNNTTIPSFDIPDIPAFAIPDVPALAIPDVPAFVIPDVPGFNIPDIPGVVIPDVPKIELGPYLCVTINTCFCPCSELDPFTFDCCCVNEEVCVIPEFTLFPGITLPDFPGIPIPDFPGIPIPDFPGIPIPDFPGISIPDFPGLEIPEVPEINLSEVFFELPTIPTFSDFLMDEGICPDAGIFDLPNGYVARLARWAFEYDLDNFLTLDPVSLASAALVWGVERVVLTDGVVYGSHGADYAEYLQKANVAEKFFKGEIVGVIGGKITKNTSNADQILVISTNPLVLGNMQDPSDMDHFEKVAFLGQVPVFVQGPVELGDYIIPSGNNDGMGRAVSPGSLTTTSLSKVVGKAWSTNPNHNLSLINVSIGLKPTELAEIIEAQDVFESQIQQEIENQGSQSEILSHDIDQIKQYLGILENE